MKVVVALLTSIVVLLASFVWYESLRPSKELPTTETKHVTEQPTSTPGESPHIAPVAQLHGDDLLPRYATTIHESKEFIYYMPRWEKDGCPPVRAVEKTTRLHSDIRVENCGDSPKELLPLLVLPFRHSWNATTTKLIAYNFETRKEVVLLEVSSPESLFAGMWGGWKFISDYEYLGQNKIRVGVYKLYSDYKDVPKENFEDPHPAKVRDVLIDLRTLKTEGE